MTTKTAIKISNLNYTYEKSKEPTLSNINLTIPKGQFTVLMGAAGAGKTTLLLTLNGLIPQFMEGHFEGSVEIGDSFTDETPIQQLIQKIGLVMQDPETQIFGLTVKEDVAFGPSNLGLLIEEIEMRIHDCLAKVGLSGYEERSTEYLSGGEKQRLAVAGILAIGPDIIVLDEPTSELDPDGKDAIFGITKDLQKQRGMTIVMAEHESERVLAYADHVVVIQDGLIKWQGDPQTLFAQEDLVKQFSLRPPEIAKLYWEFTKQGGQLGEKCPRTVEELYRLLNIQSLPYPSTQQIHYEENMNLPIDTSEPILQVENLRHVYPNGREALKGISTTIYKGDYIAIIGQNGAGKSTFCKHFNRLLSPTSGRILFKGEDISDKTTSDLAQHIGYVFQNPDHQIFSPTVYEEVTWGLKIRGVGEKKQKELAQEVLEFVGLNKYASQHPLSLSKGLRQRLAVATVLILEPDVLIIDEPTTGQDWQGTQDMLRLINRLHEKGHTIIIITHNMSLVTDHAKRVFIMGNGQLLKDCKPEETFIDHEILREARIKPTQLVQLAEKLHLSHHDISVTSLVRKLMEGVPKHA
ncbi:MAG TPA: energy-coupling factor transporter ATPase [Bacillus sp. (in: firmicutes)]|nr:energy-coupling factor transporter ATPase [Bacillus sp. (in: firmicutes)]